MEPQSLKQRGSAVCQSGDVPSKVKRLTAPGTFRLFFVSFSEVTVISYSNLFCLLNEKEVGLKIAFLAMAIGRMKHFYTRWKPYFEK